MATADTTNRYQREHQTVYAGEPAGPCAMVIFGAAGDLTKRKLVPALFNLAKANLLSRNISPS